MSPRIRNNRRKIRAFDRRSREPTRNLDTFQTKLCRWRKQWRIEKTRNERKREKTKEQRKKNAERKEEEKK